MFDSLFKSKELIWHDTDKKVRPRTRNCREEQSSHQMNIERDIVAKVATLKTVRVELTALITQGARSIKPLQIKHWLEEFLGRPLEIARVQRDEIQLHQC